MKILTDTKGQNYYVPDTLAFTKLDLAESIADRVSESKYFKGEFSVNCEYSAIIDNCFNNFTDTNIEQFIQRYDDAITIMANDTAAANHAIEVAYSILACSVDPLYMWDIC